ncbi:MAG: hypothetical protein ACE5WD_14010 [Candidatus Aminicenantia bacterium]
MRKRFKINKSLIWDYDFEGKYETEEFKKWYLARVLTRGTAKDIREIGFDIIKEYLPFLNLPRKVREFWVWYFILEENESIDRVSREIS